MGDAIKKSYVIGVDTGGTFTDVIVLTETGETVAGKAPTTPHDFSVGVMDALHEVAKSMNMSRSDLLKQCLAFKHGTTVATNAVITRTGAKVGFITTKGLEDTTLIGRAIQRVDGLSEMDIKHLAWVIKPEPIVPKPRLKGVYERIDYAGSVVVPIDLEHAKAQIRSLVEEEKVEAIGVSFLFSWVNPVHEQKVENLINEMYPNHGLYLSISHELAPVLGEYARANAVILNCFLGRIMESYIDNLDKGLRAERLKGPLMIMQANGGIVSKEELAPVATLSSGPAGGAIATQYMGNINGHQNVVSADMGGTSFDVGLIIDGHYRYAREPIISRWRVAQPIIDIESIGAGGGTIARADPEAHRLLVGPESAGASPGPVCYDAGGTEPTVTDADLVLGLLNPDYFLGGRMKLNKAKAEQAIKEKIAVPLNMDVIEAAAGIYDIVNSHMSDLIRKQVVRTGRIPEEFVLYAFGGAGPVHAAAYGARLGIKEAYALPTSAVFSAFGIAGADVVRTRIRSVGYVMPVAPDVLNSTIGKVESDLAIAMSKEGLRLQDLRFRRTFHMRYRRQLKFLAVEVPVKKYDEGDIKQIIESWETKYDEVFGMGTAYPQAGMELVTITIDAIATAAKPSLKRYAEAGSNASGAVKGYRDAFFTDSINRFVRTTIYDYDRLNPGNVIEGPAIVETPITTVVIPPSKIGRVDQYRNLVLQV